MLEYAPMLHVSCYAQNYAGIIRQGLVLLSILLRTTRFKFEFTNDANFQLFAGEFKMYAYRHTDIQTWPHTTHLCALHSPHLY